MPRSPDDAGPTTPGLATVAALHVLGFLSGGAALVYEVAWTRRLTFVFGASIRAVSAVLAAYMAGLALGALLVGRRATRRPLAAFALLEAGVGAAGLCVPALLGRIRLLDTRLYDGGAASGRLTALRFALAFLVVGAPASLMGATFPVLVRAAVGARSRAGTRVGSLYAANTAGAVAGTLLAGFALLGALGVTRTEHVAAAVNACVALGAVACWWAGARAPSSPPVVASPAAYPGAGTVVLASCVAGAASLAAEVLWSRALAFSASWLNTTTYAFPAMLGVFLACVALGSALATPWVERTAQPARLYGALVALAGAGVALSAAVLASRGAAPSARAIDDAGNLRFGYAVANLVYSSAALVGAPALLLGAAFPAAARAMGAMSASAGPVVSRLYAANTAGAIAGSVLAAFVVVPRVGVTHGLVAVGALLAATGVAVVARAPGARRGFAVALGGVALGAVAGVQTWLPARARLALDDAPIVFYEEGPTATVAVARARDGFLRIDVDGVPVAGTSPTMLTDQKSLAHYPMMLAAHPRRALTVGFGSGGTSYSYLLHAALEHVDAVEIAPEVLHGAPYLTASNHGVLARGDPRYRVILDDARSYLAHTQQRYDVIATDCTDLRYRSNANLYDLEYFQFCRARLSPDGLVAVWLPLGGLSRAMFRVALRTFGEVFPDFVVFWPNGYPSHYVVLVGWRGARELRWDRLVARVSPPAVQRDLGEVALADPAKLLSTFAADGRALRDALRDAPLNTEDHPVLEFRAPWSGYAPRAAVDNLEFLLDHRVPAASLLADALPEAAAARLARMESALVPLAEAHAASFAGDTLRAARLYLEALALAPDDDAVRARVTELLPDLAARANEPWAAVLRCRAAQLAGDGASARACYDALPRDSGDDVLDTAAHWRAGP